MVDAMYKMILKQLWNERKGNLFIWLEMLVVSIFLWYAADALFVMYRLYSQPLGFNIEHTYHVSFDVIPEESPDYDTTSVHSERGGGDYLTLMDRIRRNPSVESICFTTGVHFHYRGSNQYATFRKDSLIRNGFVRYVSPTYFEVFDVKTAQGGSPSELVDALRDNQVVVTGTVADSFFGDLAAAVRQEIYITDQGSRDSVAYRIGGVCEKQRYCEFTGYDYAYYKLVDENKVAEEGDWVGEGLNTFIRVKPGADGAAFAADFRKEMEQQLRVAIARAIVGNPDIILADEPTGNLDSKMGIEVMDLLHQLNKEDGRTIVMVTHNEAQAKQTSRTVRFFDGRQVQ